MVVDKKEDGEMSATPPSPHFGFKVSMITGGLKGYLWEFISLFALKEIFVHKCQKNLSMIKINSGKEYKLDSGCGRLKLIRTPRIHYSIKSSSEFFYRYSTSVES